MQKKKWCCEGLNSKMMTGLWPIQSDNIKWFTALYRCTKCGEYTIRGEKNSLTYNTKVWVISAEEAEKLIKEKEEFKNEK